MARLPDAIPLNAPRGERASTDTVRPDTSGIDALAQGVAQAGEHLGHIAEVQQAVDDKKAVAATQGTRAEFEAKFAERAETPDAAQAGFAASQLAEFDKHFQYDQQRTDLKPRASAAQRRLLTRYRAQVGERAIAVEAKARAGVVAEQLRAKDETAVAGAMAGYVNAYAPRYQALADGFDGSQAGFAESVRSAHAEVAKGVLDQAPDRLKPQLEARLANQGLTAYAQALEVEDKAHDAYVLTGANTTAQALANGVLSNPLAYDGAKAELDRTAGVLPRPIQKKFREDQGELLAAARVEGLVRRGDLAQAQAELNDGRYDKVLSPARKDGLLNGIQAEAARRAEELLRASEFGGAVDPRAVAANAKLAGRADLSAQADFLAMTGAATPAALNRIEGGGGKAGFAEAADFVIDDLEGGDALIVNDNGRGASRFGINQAANPDLNVPGLTRPQAVARYRKYWAEVGASQLPPGLDIAAFDAAVLFGGDDARKWLGESGGDVGRFLSLEQAQMQALAAKDPKKYGDDLNGWLNRIGKVRVEAARRVAFANTEEGLATDPVKFALGGPQRAPLANVPPLDPDQLGQPGWAQALKGRLAVGVMMHDRWHAPLRLLTNAEASYYKDAIERDPAAGVQLALAAQGALGDVGARALMGELGKQGEASVQLHLADLAAGGLTGYARQAANGLGLKAKGATLPQTLQTAVKSQLDLRAAVFAGMPDVRLVAQQTAEAAMLADHEAGTVKPAAFYVQGALGGRTVAGKVYGGVTEVNGRETVIPHWLAADRADDALDVMAQSWASTGRGPYFADGSRVDADKLKRARLQMRADGRYQLLNGNGSVATTKDGRPFVFDWDDAREGLAKRLGAGAVIAGGR